MKTKKLWVEITGILGVIFFVLSACQSAEVSMPTPSFVAPSASETPAPTWTPSSVPTEFFTDTPEPTIAPTPTETPTPEPVEIQFPLSDVLINFGSSNFECEENILSPAQVWISEYPYADKSPILKDENIGYYYPTWSPDGEWFAYLAIERKNPVENIFDGFRDVIYGESDSIGMVRRDGSEAKKLTDLFPRLEAHSLQNSDDGIVEVCDGSFGIQGIDGWSPDGRWVVFSYTSFVQSTSGISGGLYFLNVQTLEIYNFEDARTPLWLSADEFAVFQKDAKQIAIYTPTVSKPIKVFSFPPQLSSNYQFSSLFGNKEKDGLFIVGLDGYLAKESDLWELDFESGEWKIVASFDNSFSLIDLGKAKGVFCNSEDDTFLFREIEHWEITGSIQKADSRCSSTHFQDGAGNEVVAFLTGETVDEVWVTSVYGRTPDNQLLFSLENLGFEYSHFAQLLDLAWKP